MIQLAANEAYRRWAPTYDGENAFSGIECGLVERLSPSPRGLRLLDVGCGTGRRLVGTGASQAVGVELCPEMLAAGRRVHRFGPEVRLLEGDACALPVPSACSDLVWCRLVVGHLPSCEAAYAELGRVAARGGQIVVTDFHPAAFASGLRRTFRDGELVVEVEHHVHEIWHQVDAAAAAGLRLIEAAEAGAGPAVRSFYEQAGKAECYQAHLGQPIVLALLFRRDG